jgi:hypothetical protein
MKRGISALASATLLGASLFLGAGAANAITCPAGQHAITMGGVSDCVPDASGGGTGGAIIVDGRGQKQAPIGQIVMPPQAPAAPAWNPPAYTPPPVYTAPRAPAYTAPQAPAYRAPAYSAPQTPARSTPGTGGTYRAPAVGQAPVYTAPGGQAVAKNDQGVWVDPSTGVAADPGVAAEAEQAAADPAVEAQQKAEQEVQAAKVVQAAKTASVTKAVNQAIVKRQIEAALNKALDKALSR